MFVNSACIHPRECSEPRAMMVFARNTHCLAVLLMGISLVSLTKASDNTHSAAPICTLHVYPDTACTRNPYKKTSGMTVDECCQNCSLDTQCQGFTHHPGNLCLYSLGAGVIDPAHEKGITCGTVNPLPPPGPPGRLLS